MAGIPIELLIAGASGVVGLSGYAGQYSEDLVAIGVGSAAAFAARAGFDAGMKTTKDVNKVSGEVGADALDQAMDALDAYAAQEE